MTIVYLIKNMINGKMYIGQTSRTLERRWYEHCWHASRGESGVLYRAIRKYGKDAFWPMILITLESDEADVWEQKWIKLLKTTIRGYNVSIGGAAPFKGGKHTDEWRERHSRKMTGNGHPLFGKKQSFEAKQKISRTKLSQNRRGPKTHNYRQDIPASVVMLLYASGEPKRSISRLLEIDRNAINTRLRNNSKESTKDLQCESA